MADGGVDGAAALRRGRVGAAIDWRMRYLFIVLCFFSPGVEAQDYKVIHFVSAHAPFPDTARDRGHLDGDSIFQPRAGHYDDSSCNNYGYIMTAI